MEHLRQEHKKAYCASSASLVFPVAMVVGLGFMMCSLLFFSVRERERSLIQIEFESRARTQTAFLQKGIERHLEVVESIGGLYDSSSEVTRQEFELFVKRPLSIHTDIQALEWIPRVKYADKPFYEKTAEEEGFLNFKFMERNDKGEMVEVRDREEYFPVYFAEPFDRNKTAFGFDLASEPTRFAALSRARDTGMITATKRIKLVQETTGQYGFLIFRPAYKNGIIPSTVKDRREKLVGFALSVFRFPDTIESFLKEINEADIDINFYDETASPGQRFLYRYQTNIGKIKNGETNDGESQIYKGLHWETKLNLAGIEWTLLFYPTERFLSSHRVWLAWVVLAGGFLFTGFIGAYIFSALSRTAKVEGLAAELSKTNEELTREVSERKEAENALREAARTIEEDRTKIREVNQELAANEKKLRVMLDSLKKTHDELKMTQTQLIQSDRLAAIGQLAAGVAHEINNPIGYIMSNLSTLDKYISSLLEVLRATNQLKIAAEQGRDFEKVIRQVKEINELEKKVNMDFILNDIATLLRESESGVERIVNIVNDLKTFTRSDKNVIEPTNLHQVMDSVINIVWNELKYKAELKKEYSDIPLVNCNGQQLSQVFMNMLVNAAQAIETKGTITVKTYAKQDQVFVEIVDTGKGIRKEIVDKIYDPFFTTKEVGKGTGLGLSISYDIIKKHHGKIEVESEVGKSTRFIISLPV